MVHCPFCETYLERCPCCETSFCPDCRATEEQLEQKVWEMKPDESD